MEHILYLLTGLITFVVLGTITVAVMSIGSEILTFIKNLINKYTGLNIELILFVTFLAFVVITLLIGAHDVGEGVFKSITN